MTNFEFALKEVLGIEGGYVDNKNDSGGKTNFGITEYTAKEAGYTGDMKNLTKEDAIQIYKKLFWDNPKLYLIQDKNIAKEVFEFGVNGGMKIAIKVLQRAYNSMNFDIIKEDGVLGEITANKINNYKYKSSLLKVQNILQGMYYILLAEDEKDNLKLFRNHQEKPGIDKNKHFIRGWINKRVKV